MRIKQHIVSAWVTQLSGQIMKDGIYRHEARTRIHK